MIENFKLNWEGVSDEAPIVNAERIYRTVKENGEIKKIPTRSITITFQGDTLPVTIYLYGIAPTRVHMYIPRVRICYNCFAFGHISTLCKRERKCINCGNAYHTQNGDERCTSDTRCNNYQGNHLPNNKDCRHYQIN